MSNSCFLIPKISKRDGSKIESNMYKTLLVMSGMNRAKANDIYFKINSSDFKDKIGFAINKDSNGEYDIESMSEFVDISKQVGEQSFIDYLELKYRFKDNDGSDISLIDTPENRQFFINKVNKFNKDSPLNDKYAAVIKIDHDTHKISAMIDRISSKFHPDTSDYNKYNKLANALEKTLNSIGVGVECLSAAETRGKNLLNGLDGISDFSVTKRTADGLLDIIKIANGEKGIKAIPEEASHVIIEFTKGYSIRDRFVNLIKSKHLEEEILGDDYSKYFVKYNGNMNQIAEECAGKILSETLESGYIRNGIPGPIMNRLINHIKDMVKDADTKDLEDAIKDIDKTSKTLAEQVLSGSIAKFIVAKNVDVTKKMYKISQAADNVVVHDEKEKESLLQKALNIELKRKKIYGSSDANLKKGGETLFDKSQNELIQKLRDDIVHKELNAGLNLYISKEAKRVTDLLKMISDIAENPNMPSKIACSKLNNVIQFLYSYKGINKEIQRHIDEYTELTDEERKNIISLVEQIPLGYLEAQLNKVAFAKFGEFLGPFLTPEMKKAWTEMHGIDFNMNDFLETADEDISLIETWMESMADCPDERLQAIDDIVKRSYHKSRLRYIEAQQRINMMAQKYKNMGVTNYEFMFEVDDKGHKTGDYVHQYKKGAIKEARDKFFKDYVKKHGYIDKDRTSDSYLAYDKAWREFFNSDDDNLKSSLYSDDFNKLTQNQKNLYKDFMKIKQEMDSFIPPRYTYRCNAIKITKSLFEIARKNPSSIGDLATGVANEFIKTCSDTDILVKSKMKDFQGNAVQNLPVYYTKLIPGMTNDGLSTDIFATLDAYSLMALNYDELSNVISQIELGRQVLRETNVGVRENGKKVMEILKVFSKDDVDENGNFTTTEDDIHSRLTKPFAGSNGSRRLDMYYEMQVYQHYKQNHVVKVGSKEVSSSKVVDALIGATTVTHMAFNYINDVSNVLTGLTVGQIEARGAEYFDKKDLSYADSTYFNNLGNYIGNIFDPIKKDKLHLFDQLFNVLQDYEDSWRETKFEESSIMSKIMHKSISMIGQNSGELWLQNRTALAVANTVRMKSKNGVECNLWDAYEAVPLDKDHPDYGYKLKLKDGYTKIDGTKFTEDDVVKFTRKIAAINQHMHGIYNKQDMAMLKYYGAGRCVSQFRNFLVPSMIKLFGKKRFNRDLNDTMEGYYRTFGRLAAQIIKERQGLTFNIMTQYHKLSDKDKANVRRAVYHLGVVVGLSIAIFALRFFMGGLPPDKKPWALKMLEYELSRLYTDEAALTPSPAMLSSGEKILNSPMAIISTLDDVTNFFGILNFNNYEYFNGDGAVIKSGVYKDYSKAEVCWIKLPFPPFTLYKNLIRMGGIDQLTKYYKY